MPNSNIFLLSTLPRLNTQTVTGISTRRFTVSDNLDDVPSLESQVSRHGVLLQDTRQLSLLQSISLQERGLLLLR